MYCSLLCCVIQQTPKGRHGLSRWLSGKESAYQCRRHRFDPWVVKIPWRRKWHPTPVFLPEKSQGQRSLIGCGPLGSKRFRQDLANEQKKGRYGKQYIYIYIYIMCIIYIYVYICMCIYMYIYIIYRGECGQRGLWKKQRTTINQQRREEGTNGAKNSHQGAMIKVRILRFTAIEASSENSF